MKKSQRRKLLVLCEDGLHSRFVARLAERWGIGPRELMLDAAPRAQGSAAHYVLNRFVEFVKRWRTERGNTDASALVIIDGDEKGSRLRRQQCLEKLRAAGEPALDPTDTRFAIIVPCWHIETWIAWLCEHRPIDEETRYKPEDPHGGEVGRKIRDGEYSAKQAVKAWMPPMEGEDLHVPSLCAARIELRRFGVTA